MQPEAPLLLAGGQSGHSWSEHYEEQIDAWLEGEYYEVGISGEDGL